MSLNKIDMFNKDIVELCNKSQKKSGLSVQNLRTIADIMDTKSKAKSREGLCDAIIKKVYENRLNGDADFYNENWGFDKFSCKKMSKPVKSPPPPAPPVPQPPVPQPPVPPPAPSVPPLKKANNESTKPLKPGEKKPPSWDDVMTEMKNMKLKKKAE
jgi:hypothetical protein